MATRVSVATDDFNRASLGANWAQLHSANGDVAISGSAFVFGNSTQNENNRQAARWIGAGTFTDDQYAKIAISGFAFQSSSFSIGVIVRASADTGANRDMYLFEMEMNSGGPTYTTRLVKIVDGTSTVLNSASQTWANGDTIELEVEGTTLRGMRNGVALGGSFTQTDTSLTTGLPGIAASGGASTVAQGDNWEAGNLTTVPPPSGIAFASYYNFPKWKLRQPIIGGRTR